MDALLFADVLAAVCVAGAWPPVARVTCVRGVVVGLVSVVVQWCLLFWLIVGAGWQVAVFLFALGCR